MCPWKTGFYLMMGRKKKKRERALFMLVKQHPDVVLFVVGVSDLDGGRGTALFASVFFLLVSV